jgi:hypothetical protein
MSDLDVDRLSLKLHGVSRGDAQRLSSLVAQGLAEATVRPRGGVNALQVTVNSLPGTSMQELANQIVANLVGQLGRTL